ncbi:unnamed protein product [Rotaria magnacalcarata]|uniref:NAD-dependent epimerase/dehydratase domain-containing protein n=1 Tax=Rotaria magnacalcarata TaxID=392030 RepID=A0A816NS76_9BILA|nr:unnamed protein product [Rotaria magnacalcarata]
MVAPTSQVAPSSGTVVKWNSRLAGHVPHDASYYSKCLLGGILACGLTHTAICPLDVTKCNMQVNPDKYKGLVKGIRLIVAEEGSRAIWKGWLPTFFGYSAQGAFKYGLYEVFKDQYANMLGKENFEKYKGLVWCAASASAEFFADLALCPLEMVKVKVQTAPHGTFPIAFGQAWSQMSAKKAETGFPYRSLVPLWSRQVPYTVAKFFFFEKVVQLFYTYVFTKPKETYSKGTQLGVTFASGYTAGVICAIVSHPADSVVSLLGKPANKSKTLGQIIKETGFVKLATKGLGTRIIMIGTLTGLQWWIYDTFKTALGMVSSNALVFGANGYIGYGIALGLRRAGFHAYGAIRSSLHSALLVKNEIEPIVIESFEKVDTIADQLVKCSIIVDAVAGKQRTQNGKLAHYAPLFIFTSGIMTYGDTSVNGLRPLDETIKPNPQTMEMKAREEYENLVLATSSNIVHTTVIRPGFVYGSHGGFVADLFYSEKPAVIHGRRDKRWSWIHIDDLAEGYILVARASRSLVSGQMWNLAAPNDNPTYEEVRSNMARASGQQIEYKEASSSDETPPRWDTDSIINPSKAIEQLGWRPKHVGYIQEIETYYKSWAAYKQQQ